MNGKWTIGLQMQAGTERTRRAVEGVLQYVGEHDLAIRDFNAAIEVATLPELPPWTGKADGVVTDLGRIPGVVEYLRRGGVPVVNTASDLCHEVVSVFADPLSMAKVAVEHFLERGLRHFAYVGHLFSDGSHERRRAFAETLARRKFRLQVCETEKIFTGNYLDFASLDEVEANFVRLIQRGKKPLGLLALNDGWAVAACRIAQELGFSIPDDVAVLGAGDTDVARIATPPISSIRSPRERVGYEAARLVHRMIQGERIARRNVKLPVLELVPRESTVGKRRAGVTDVARALEFIRSKACEGIAVKDVAAHVHVPLRTFELQFAAAVGQTVGEAIRRERLAHAKSLLEMTDLPLATVAHQVGFTNASYLIDFFRRWLDTTPAKYRRKQRGK